MKLPVDQRFASLGQLIAMAADKNLPDEVTAHLCRLGTVLICGNIERCVEILILQRFDGRAPPQMIAFIKRHFKRGTNYDCEEIRTLLFRFDPEWGRRFERYIADNEAVKEQISGCYAVRNSVAHGGTGSLGSAILRQYYEASLSLVAEIEASMR